MVKRLHADIKTQNFTVNVNLIYFLSVLMDCSCEKSFAYLINFLNKHVHIDKEQNTT